MRISIDDFGTGHASLNDPRHLAVDHLKIDRSFVMEIGTNARGRALATAITELAEALNITWVAEGVETEAQAKFFSATHCRELKGCLFARPFPVGRPWRFLGDAIKAPQARAAPASDSHPEVLEAA